MKPEVFALLGTISGWLLMFYVGLKSLDTLIWLNRTAPGTGASPAQFFAAQPFGIWMLFAEIVLFGAVPALIFLSCRGRAGTGWLLAASFLACAGVATNRLVMTIQTLVVPTLRFEPYMLYWPSWQEFATFLAVIAYGVILYSLSFRYLRLFPQERELQQG